MRGTIMEQNKNVWIVVFIIIALLLLLGGLGAGGYGMMGFGMGFGFLFMILFWGVIVWMIISFINAAQTNKKDEDAPTILKKRYASGKITKKQYEEMKKEFN